MKALLLILDGVGLRDAAAGNAATAETMPVFFGLAARHGVAQLAASGPAVGLGEGHAGNSEIGHLTIGAGERLLSTLESIERAYHDGSWAASPVWEEIGRAPALHLVGLVSDAGVHGWWPSLVRSAELAARHGVPRIHVHAVLDGVDSQAGSAPRLLRELLAGLERVPGAACSTVIGRKWACDRSGRLEVTAYLVERLEGAVPLPVFRHELLAEHLAGHPSESDFPGHRMPGGEAIADGAAVLLTNHRADRTRQLAQLLAARHPVFGLVEMDGAIEPARVFFPKRPLTRGLAFELRRQGIESARVAEQCKFPHVTYFLNGFNPELGEKAVCLPSVPEASIGEHPEMSAAEVVTAVVEELRAPGRRAVVANLANLDQVGHLGRYDLAVRAAAVVDPLLRRLHEECRERGWTLVVTSDHGNADTMLDECGRPFGSHSLAPVPLVVAPAPDAPFRLAATAGSLANVAATFLEALGLCPPAWMEPSLLAGEGASQEPR